MAGGEGALLLDVDGNRFIDWVAGIGVASIGHGHPALAQALFEQASQLSSTSFASPRGRLLRRIVEHAPHPSLDRVQLYSSGPKRWKVRCDWRVPRRVIVRLSLLGRLSRQDPRRDRLVRQRVQHGQLPILPGQHLAPYADCSRCALRRTPDTCQLACIDFCDQLRLATAADVAAILVEPIQGTAGNVVPHPDFCPRWRRLPKNTVRCSLPTR